METVIDWSEAPEWASAYAQVIYEHETTAKDFAWVCAEGYNVNPFGKTEQVCHPYMKEFFTTDRFRLIEFRPAKNQAWTGEGLPPVGIEIEALLPGLGNTTYFWQRAKVVHGALPDSPGEVLVFSLETTRPAWSDKFRPVRTAEQIAAEEREAALKEMLALVGGSSRRSAEALYDAGYRKQVTP